MHFLAFELLQRCKNVLMTLGRKGEILDWGIPPSSSADTLKRVAVDRFSSKLLNGLSISELVKILEARRKTNKSTTAVKV